MAAPWDQQAGESAKAYAAFCLYRDLGPQRSLDEASRRYHQPAGQEGPQPPSKRLRRASGTIRRWAQRWDWQTRARAWDQEIERLKQVQQQAAVKEMNQRHAKESLMLQNKAVERLHQLRPEELKPRDLLAFLIDAAKLERLACGEPTEHVVEDHHFEDLEELTDDELARIIASEQGHLAPARRRGTAAAKDRPEESV
jgi:hypothetical protein